MPRGEGRSETGKEMREGEKSYDSRVVVSVFRHGEKEKTPPEGKTGDAEVLLTPAGRKGAKDAGDMYRLPEEGVAQSVAFGSPRKRTQETAAFVMGGAEETIDGTEDIDALKKKLDKGREHGSKVGTDKRLDFDTGSAEYEKEMMGAFKAGNLIEWMVKESDRIAEKVGDKHGSTYSREAAGVAELVKKYFTIAPRFNELVKGKKGYEDTMQRFLGTHQSVGESFLAKVIEKTKGEEERDKFVEAVNKSGFGFVEGFQVEIKMGKGKKQPKAEIYYRKRDKEGKTVFEFHEELKADLLEEIMKEGTK